MTKPDDGGPTEREAEAAGRDAVDGGANTENCHIRFFSERRLTDAWQRGYDAMLAEREKGTP